MILSDVDERKLLFSGFPVTQRHQLAGVKDAADDTNGDADENDEQKLKNFVQRATEARIDHMTYSTQRDKAVVTFHTTPG